MEDGPVEKRNQTRGTSGQGNNKSVKPLFFLR